MPQDRAGATPQRPSATPQRSSAAARQSAHRPRAARSRTVSKLVLGLIGLALVAVFLAGLAAPSAALAANQKPAVTFLSPVSGTTVGGNTVLVSGRAFTSFGRSLVTKVMFGTKAARYHVRAHSQVVCTAPAGKGTVNVIVTTRGGVSARVTADRYTYKAPVAAPTITAFAFASRETNSSGDISGVIDQSAHTIAVTVPFGTTVTALVATFTTTGSAVKVGSITQASSVTPNDFSAPVVYTVTAAGAPAQSYRVTVTVAANSAKAITSFGFETNIKHAVTGTIDQSAHAIALTWPYGTDLSELVASFTTTGASVAVGDAPQTSGMSYIDFSAPVVYTVTAADGSTQDYTVSVTVAPAPPAVDKVNPPSGPMSDAAGVTIMGSGFTGATAVHFGTELATSAVVVSDSQITCTVPTYDASGTVDVTVTTPAGTSAVGEDDTYSYVPVVTSLSSSVGDLDGGFTMTIKGDGFTGVTAVAFGVNDPATDVVVLTGGKITCTVPAWIPEIPQLASVTVTGPAGTSNAAYDGITYYYSLDN